MAVKYLSRRLNGLKDDFSFKFPPKCHRTASVGLLFADDLLIFFKGDTDSYFL